MLSLLCFFVRNLIKRNNEVCRSKLYKSRSESLRNQIASQELFTMWILGDSIIAECDVNQLKPKLINLSIPGETTAGLIQRIPKYTEIYQPQLVVMNVGVNDLRFRSSLIVLKNYQTIYKLFSKSKIYIISVLPVSEGRSKRDPAISNKKIVELNNMIKAWSAMKSRITYIDAYSYFTSPTGNLRSEFDSADGLHLNEKGTSLLVEIMSKYVN